jgi:hypothetical protein
LRGVIETLTGELSDDQRAELANSLQVIYDAATLYLTDHLSSKS